MLVSGILLLANGTFLFSQNDSSAYYLEQIEKYTDLVLEKQVPHDSCIWAYKMYHQYSFKQDKSVQGVNDMRSQLGKFFRASDYFGAIQLIDSLVSWIKPEWLDDNSEGGLVYLYIFKGYAYMKSNNDLSAIDAYEEALEKYQNKFGNLCKTEKLIRCLLVKGKDTDYNQLWRFIHYPLVQLYKEIGDHDLAKSYLPNEEELALILANDMLVEREIARIYTELVGSTLAEKDTLQAYLLSQRYSELYPKNTQEKFVTLINRALIERTLKKFEDAHFNLNQIIKYAEKQGKSDIVLNRLWRDGHLFKGYTYRDQALSLANDEPEKAKKIFDEARNEYDLLLDFLSQNPEERVRLFNSKGDYHKELIHLFHSKGDIEFYNQQYAEAEKYYQKALSSIWKGETSRILPSADSLILNFDLFYTLEGLGKIWHEQYRLDKNLSLLQKASEAYTLVFALEDSFRVRYPTQVSRKIQQIKGQKRLKTRMRIAYDLWQEKKEEGSIHMALNIMDRSRALEMQAHLQGSSVEKNLSKSHKGLIDTISSIQERLYQFYLETPEQSDEESHQTLIQQTNEELIAYRKKLKKQNPTYYRLKFTPQASDVKELQKNLMEKEALINYYWEGNILYSLVIGHDFYDLEQQPITEELKEQISFITAFTQNQRPTKKDQLTYQKAAYALYKQLLGGIMDRNLETLIIVPDGALSHLAFEALLTEKVDVNKAVDYRKLQYVLQKYLIRYQFVPHFLLKEERPASSEEKLPLLYAGFAPTYNFDFTSESGRADIGNLEFNVHEIDSVYALFSTFSSNNQRFLDSAAREKKFREIAPQAELLHIAMHSFSNEGSFNATFLAQPYLLFSNQKEKGNHDDRLFMQEVYSLNLQAEMMVLSACNTGTGQWEVGEGMLSLGRAFRMAGCNNIISSLWNVNDESSQKVILSFFEFLKKGDGKAEALRKAKEAYLFSPQVTNRKAAPYYWAQFVLMGDNAKLAAFEEQIHVLYFILTGALLLIFLVGLWFYYKRSYTYTGISL